MADTTFNMKRNREGGEGLISGRSGPSSSHSTDFAVEGRQPENANRPPSPSLLENRRKAGIPNTGEQEASTPKAEPNEATRSGEVAGSHPGAAFSHQEGPHARGSDNMASGSSPSDHPTASESSTDASLLLNRIEHSLTVYDNYKEKNVSLSIKGIIELHKSCIDALRLIEEERNECQKRIEELKSAVTGAESSVKQAKSDLAELNKPRGASTASSQEIQAPNPDREVTAPPRTKDTIKGEIENLRVLRNEIKEIPNLDKEHEKLKKEISQLEEEVITLRDIQIIVEPFYAQKPTNWDSMQKLHKLDDMQAMITILEYLEIPGLDLGSQKNLSMALDLSGQAIQQATDCLPPSEGNLVEGVQDCLTTLKGIQAPLWEQLSVQINSCKSQGEQISGSSSIPSDFTLEPPHFSNLEEEYNSSYIQEITGQVKLWPNTIREMIEELSDGIDRFEQKPESLKADEQQPPPDFIQDLEQRQITLRVIARQANKDCSRHCKIHNLLDYGLSEKVDQTEIKAYILRKIENAGGDIGLKNLQIGKIEQKITETINNGLLQTDATQIRDTDQMEKKIKETIKGLQMEKDTLIEANRKVKRSQARADRKELRDAELRDAKAKELRDAKAKELRDATQLRDTKSAELKEAAKYAKKHEPEIEAIRSRIALYLIED